MLQWFSCPRSGELFRKLFLALLFAVFAAALLPRPAAAQSVPAAPSIAAPNSSLNQGVQIIQQPLGLPATDIRTIIANVIRAALGLVGIVFLVMILYGGFLWMTAGGNEEQIGSAKVVLKNGVIGLIIILSAYGIVLFVMRLLGIGGAGGAGETAVAPNVSDQNFTGSGALGQIIKDHYPARGQVGVPRNTKIVITFRRPIRLDSLAVDTNASGVFGDCVNLGSTMKWNTDCDHLKLDNDHIAISAVLNQNGQPALQPISGAAVIASPVNGQVTTIVIRPDDYLGNDHDFITYLVHIGPSILLDDPTNGNPSIFNGQTNNYYEWKFTADNKLDLSPPVVTDVFPGAKTTEAKNSVIQVSFNKPMDPSEIQGTFSSQDNYYYLTGNSVFLQSGHSSAPAGAFRLTNGYRTLEFAPSAKCGVNACGGDIYCLPVCDAPGASCSQDGYTVLLKAAQTFSGTSFEAIPFSGVMDLSGNALDGNNNGKVDAVTSTAFVFSDQERPDNYFWPFTINNTIDNTAPYIKQVSPGPDATGVAANDDWTILFSKRMQTDSMYNGISIDQKPPQATPLCLTPRTVTADAGSLTTVGHCPFIDTSRNYYFPSVGSQAEDVHFNCLFPGKGPSGIGAGRQSLVCQDTDPANCCPVGVTLDKSFCCNGQVKATLQDQQSCIADLKARSL